MRFQNFPFGESAAVKGSGAVFHHSSEERGQLKKNLVYIQTAKQSDKPSFLRCISQVTSEDDADLNWGLLRYSSQKCRVLHRFDGGTENVQICYKTFVDGSHNI
uniref:Uncharacterized protein n=1 Tax=Photinus pyralis TaxID=7054 RepID=A0A1Y1MTG7_PHOPY